MFLSEIYTIQLQTSSKEKLNFLTLLATSFLCSWDMGCREINWNMGLVMLLLTTCEHYYLRQCA